MNLIERLQLTTPALHQPRFHVEQHGIYCTVYDAHVPIAVVVRDTGAGGATLDVLKFSPGAVGKPATLPPYAYHYSTRLGYGVTFNWSVDTMFQNPDSDSLELCEQSESRLVFLHAGEFHDGTTIACRLTIGYDAAIGQYSYDLCWDIASTRDVGGEFANIFHNRLMHTEMNTREYDYGCYVRAGGQWEKYPITIMVTGLQKQQVNGIPLELGGGSGHLNRSGVVPMLVHRQANVPLSAGSCDTCFDMHQYAHVKANTPAHIESRFVDMGTVVAAHPEELQLIPINDIQRYPFHFGELCDFSHTIHSAQPWSGGIWVEQSGAGISDEYAHSGTRSLKLTATSDVPVRSTPYGPALAVENHTDYEASLWVKVDGDETVQATLELNAFLFTANNPQGLTAASVIGPHDWTKLVARVNSGIADNAYVLLKLSGNGKAWFDDILVRRVDRTAGE